MKIVFQHLILAFLMAMSYQAFAQKISIKGGLNISKMIVENDSANISSNDIAVTTGFHIGTTIEFPVSKVFFIETGLFFSTKGYKYSDDLSYSDPTFGTLSMSIRQKITTYNLDIPVTVKAKRKVGNVSVFGGVGPYIGLGIAGKDNYETKITLFGFPITNSGNEDIKWGSDPDTDLLKRLDVGLTANAGVEIKSILCGVSYGLGLLNLAPSSSAGNLKNRVFSITLGYKLGKK